MKILKAILLGGLIAGVLDIAYAFTVYGVLNGAQPMRILQTIAGGVLGLDAARAGGVQTSALGAALHFFMATLMAAAFVIASTIMPVLARRPLIFGPLYGVGLFAVMNYLVVPMSAIGGHGPEFGSQGFWIAVVAHVVLVGPAIALTTRAMLKPT
jgi:hypothetical protein